MLQELRARGPMSTVILGTVVVAEFVLFILFALVLTLGRALVDDGGLTLGLLGDALPEVLWQLSLSLVLGLLLGLVTALYFRFVRREPLLFLLVLLVLGYFGVVAADAEPLLTFLAAGFYVQNATRQGELLTTVLERIALPTFVIYFAILAAGIDLQGTLAYLPLVILLVIARLGALYAGAQWATAWTGRQIHTDEYLRSAFFSQDAVVLVLASVIAYPGGPFSWGPEFQAVVVATVILYLLIGPVLLKQGLEKSGETRQARRAFRGDHSQDLSQDLPSASDAPLDLPERLRQPDFDDTWLNGHMSDLRVELIDGAQETFFEPASDHFQSLQTHLHDIAQVIDDLQPELERLADELHDGADAEQLRATARSIQQDYARQMFPILERLNDTADVAVDTDQARQFFDLLRDVEDQQSQYRIEREASLDAPLDGDPQTPRDFLAPTTRPDHQEPPPAYLRLFRPYPLEIPESYRPRPDAEGRILDLAARFFDGHPQSLLLSGDSGIGKRTLLRHLIPGRLYTVESTLDPDRIAFLDLSKTSADEPDLCAHIGRRLIGRSTSDTFDHLGRQLQRWHSPIQIAVVEGASHLFRRTDQGLEHTRRFLSMIDQSSSHFLWIVVMDTPTVDFLSTHLSIDGYFSHHERLQPMAADDLESLLMIRHQLGDQDLHFQPPELPLAHRLRHQLRQLNLI